MGRRIHAEPLTRAAFAPYGEVIEKAHADRFEINDGMAIRYHDLAAVDTAAAGGRAAISIFHGRPWSLPLRPRMMERHRLGSQAFVALAPCRWLVVVAPAGAFDADAIRAFVADADKGVNYRPGTWHHPLVVLGEETDFLVVDRVAEATDCDIVDLDEGSLEIVL